jgi:ABC-type antimicrobial peptide transport system permease subunit
MADLISGLTLIEGFSRFLPALLVLIIMYAILEYTGALGKNQFLNIMVSFVISLVVLLSEKVSNVLSFMAPWFVMLIIFLIFVIIVFKSIGVSDGQIMSVFNEYKLIVWFIIFFCLVIAIVALGNVFGQELLEGQPGQQTYKQNVDGTYTAPDGSVVNVLPPGVDSNEYHSNLTSTLFHPTVLSFIVLGLISAFTIYFMTKS